MGNSLELDFKKSHVSVAVGLALVSHVLRDAPRGNSSVALANSGLLVTCSSGGSNGNPEGHAWQSLSVWRNARITQVLIGVNDRLKLTLAS